MDWLTVTISGIISLLSVGGIGWLFTVRQDRRSKDLDNKAKENEIEDIRKDNAIEDWRTLVEEYKQRVVTLSTSLDETAERSRRKDEIITDLRKQIDNLNTYAARLEIFKCGVLSCAKRVPKISNEIFEKDNVDPSKKINIEESDSQE